MKHGSDPYHARTAVPSFAECLDLFRVQLRETGDGGAAAEALMRADPIAARVLDTSGYSFEDILALAQSYGGPNEDGDDAPLLEVKTFQ